LIHGVLMFSGPKLVVLDCNTTTMESSAQSVWLVGYWVTIGDLEGSHCAYRLHNLLMPLDP